MNRDVRKMNENEQLIQAMRQTTDKRLYERYLAVLLHLEGKTQQEIADILHRTRQTIGEYIHSYQDGGLSELALDHSPGKPRTLTPDQEQRLAEMLKSQQPSDVGFEAKSTWTLKLVAAYVKREFGQPFSEKGISRVLQRLGFSYTKATYTLASADPDEQAFFQENVLPDLKKS